jgi:exonuclease VII small subunit
VARYEIEFRDERGVQHLELDDVQLEDGIYEFWRGQDVIERIPAEQIAQVRPTP